MMKQTFKTFAVVIFAMFFIPSGAMSQSPDKMSFQAVIRDVNNALVENQVVGMRISVIQDTPEGIAVYVETHTPSTNINGLVSMQIGDGTVVSGNFALIPWSDGLFFIKTEADPAGGTNYSITGVNQMLSVPFAMHSKTAESLSTPLEEYDPVFVNSAASGIVLDDINSWNNKLDEEVDPLYQNSPASGILDDDINSWNNKLDSESDPLFQNSPASGILDGDINSWNNKLDTETDPVFDSSAASDINASDITNWNNKLDVEIDDDITNELQQLTVSGDTIFISDGNYIVLPGLSDLAAFVAGPSVQQRLDEGETPLDIYNSDAALLDSLYGCDYAGGILFYLDISDGSGMVCAEADQSPNIHWYNCINTNTGATFTEIGTGALNTTFIVDDQGFGFYAASICDITEDGGFLDWYLPSRDELFAMYENLKIQDLGNLASEIYWSSSEDNDVNAWSIDFSMGGMATTLKFITQNVRAIRSFE